MVGGTGREDAEHHGDGDDRGGVIGGRTAQFLQGKEAEHDRGQAARRPRQRRNASQTSNDTSAPVSSTNGTRGSGQLPNR
jgi:hypothetical protein